MSPPVCAIAVVGMACIYPEARSPGELWENVLAQRRAFRRLPAERLRLEDFYSADATAPDATYATEGAFIEGYEFDRVAFRVAGSTYRAADLAHWLALDVAARALADAHFPEGEGLPRETTGVLMGNTLTGEFSRANAMRLRWPYVRRVVEDALAKESWSGERRTEFLAALEEKYKSPFPAVSEETLAGGLSNTIAGRICNHFNLKGGGYTVDGACASSLLAVANACSGLVSGDLDVAISGGVDLSIDPFEIVGFSKAGALAVDDMRVFDQRSAGFWPGEGCGVVVLMRHEDALAQGRRVYAVIRGWGISSDGSGGTTRPEADGQIEALRRAYRRAGFGIETVSYCEAHGTGTAVGDTTELETLARARQQATATATPMTIGSVKANIGHTKAAAGIAGLIKATMAVHTQLLPPATHCEQPHAKLGGPRPAFRVLREPELWPHGQPLRAGVSAMGFGGINAHVVLEGVVAERRAALSARELSLSRSNQDAELFLFAEASSELLATRIEKLLSIAPRISRAEMADIAARLEKTLGGGNVRAAIVATRPAELAEKLQQLKLQLTSRATPLTDFSRGIFYGASEKAPRIAFLFPGQGSPARLDGGIWRRRFESVHELYARAGLAEGGDTMSTEVMQPAVTTASVAALRVMKEFGIDAVATIGHSLGEITALHWAGAFDEEALMRLARIRGAIMSKLGSPSGAMLAVAAPWTEVQELLVAQPLAITGYNSPRQTIVAGQTDAIQALARRAAARGLIATELPVSRAFHTPLVAEATPVLADHLAREKISGVQRHVYSTVTGALLEADADLRELLCRQVTSPVRFASALEALLDKVDLWIEAGPGSVLSGLVRDSADAVVAPLDAGGNSLQGLLHALGAAFVLGAPIKTTALFAGRVTRPFPTEWKPLFFSNPCELAPISNDSNDAPKSLTARDTGRTPAVPLPTAPSPSRAIDLVRQLVAQRAELPASAVRDDSRMLSDLHLNSITVGQMVSEAAHQMKLPRIIGLTDFANATLADIARALEELKCNGDHLDTTIAPEAPPGVDAWVRAFGVEWVEEKRRDKVPSPDNSSRGWSVFAQANHPLTQPLRKALRETGTCGVAVCLPESPDTNHIPLLLEGARALLAMKASPRFLVVQHGWGGSGFARTLHLENPGIATCVVNLPRGLVRGARWAAAEAVAATGFTEVRFAGNGRRYRPQLKLFDTNSIARIHGYHVGPNDVLLVTGGGKGIAAECALELGRETGVKLALVGRSDPETDKDLANNLSRFAVAGIRSSYVRADVTDGSAVRAAVIDFERTLGSITAVLHGAGLNTPRLISELDETTFRRTVAPKLEGARNILAAVNPARIKMLVAFGSIIARTGLPGEADYATANEWLAALVNEFQAQHPRARCLTLEWSVWSGVGMGERLGRIETLAQQGIASIPVDEGVRTFCKLLRQPIKHSSMVVSGRVGRTPTLRVAEPELPLQRFLERKRVFYPGVELIVDAELSMRSDPYLEDHTIGNQSLLPAVVGLEAMAEVAMALGGWENPPVFESVELLRPVAVPSNGPLTIRLVALRRENDSIDICLRSAETDFQVDHFRAQCRVFTQGQVVGPRIAMPSVEPVNIALDPQNDLYGRILFHRGRFQKLCGYRFLKARECVAEISAEDGAVWYGPYLPAQFVLGHPATRDAALHAIQACIPHRRILPTGIERMTVMRKVSGRHLVRAKERRRDGNNFIFDVEITDMAGGLMERWEGLNLRAVETMSSRDGWPTALLAPYLERRFEELVPGVPVSIALEQGLREERPTGTDAVIQQALGRATRVWRRPDGRPMQFGDETVSAAHANDFTLAVASARGAACDLEETADRTDAVWRDLIGGDRLQLAARMAREQGENLDTAATRVWAAMECLKKIGQPAGAPLILESRTPDRWTLLRSGSIIIATCAVHLRENKLPLVTAVAQQARLENTPVAAPISRASSSA